MRTNLFIEEEKRKKKIQRGNKDPPHTTQKTRWGLLASPSRFPLETPFFIFLLSMNKDNRIYTDFDIYNYIYFHIIIELRAHASLKEHPSRHENYSHAHYFSQARAPPFASPRCAPPATPLRGEATDTRSPFARRAGRKGPLPDEWRPHFPSCFLSRLPPLRRPPSACP